MTGIACRRPFSRRSDRRQPCFSGFPETANKKSVAGMFFAVFLMLLPLMHLLPTICHGDIMAPVGACSLMQHLKSEHLIPPHVIVIDPEGRHLYAGSDLSLSVFERDITSGEIRLLEIETEARWGARDLVMSPDGHHLYVAGSNTIEVFRRENESGRLNAVEVAENGANGMDARFVNHSLSVSPDGRSLYVYSTMILFSAAKRSNEFVSAVGVFSRDTQSGKLQFVEMVRICFEHANITGSHVKALAVSPDSKNVYVSGEGDHAIAVYSRDIVTGALAFLEIHENGVNGVEGLKHVQALSVSPDGKNLYAAGHHGYESGTVVIFSRNATSGALRFEEMVKNGSNGTDGLFDVQSLALSPDGDSLYVGVDGGSITASLADYEPPAAVVFHRDRATGSLHFTEVHKNKTQGTDDLIGIESLIVSSDGEHLYTAGPAQNDPFVTKPPEKGTIGVFNRDGSSGALALHQVVRQESRLSGMNAMAMSPDGRNLYAAGPGNDEVTVFSRNDEDGMLNYLERHQNDVDCKECLSDIELMAVSPDGRNLYAAGDYGGSITVFNRDGETGALRFMEQHKDGVNGVEGIASTQSFLLSPDGRNLYAAGNQNNTIAVFMRDGATGALRYAGMHHIEATGLEDYYRIQWMTASPDGLDLYAALSNGGIIAALSRDTENGALKLVDLRRNALLSRDSGYAVDTLSLSPDGRYLYAMGKTNEANYGYNIAVFGRRIGSGALYLIELYKDIIKQPLMAPSLIASPDGHFLLVGGNRSENDKEGYVVTGLRRDIPTGKLGQVYSMSDPSESNVLKSILLSPENRNLYVGGLLDVFIFGWDADDDRIPDVMDGCPSDFQKSEPGICGCGVSDTDTDGDGVLDCMDACPFDRGDWLDSDQDGVCDNADADDDGDGVLDGGDPFPLDPAEWIDSDQDGAGDTADEDDDGDGVPDLVENAAQAGGDGNADGIPDSLQPNVASLYTDNGAHVVTLESGPGTRLSHCEAATAPDPEEDALAGLEFPYGLFSFTIDYAGADPVTLKLYLPEDAPVSTYYKYGRAPDIASDHWYEFLFDGETGAGMDNVDDTGPAGPAGSNIITLHFVDAGRGDDILRRDGRIIDLGGPAFRVESNENADGSAGSGGGCFIKTLSY